MNSRIVSAILAIMAVLAGSIVLSGLLIFASGLFYAWLSTFMPSGFAFAMIAIGGLLTVLLLIGACQVALRSALQARSKVPGNTPLGALLDVVGRDPKNVAVASLGFGFAIGVSSRLRRAALRALLGE